ncbi:hypothetical protein OAO01_08785 [Oligoflexia bacterium]|nr:hypothetical protein [Oligoflexia bacterium]
MDASELWKSHMLQDGSWFPLDHTKMGSTGVARLAKGINQNVPGKLYVTAVIPFRDGKKTVLVVLNGFIMEANMTIFFAGDPKKKSLPGWFTNRREYFDKVTQEMVQMEILNQSAGIPNIETPEFVDSAVRYAKEAMGNQEQEW